MMHPKLETRWHVLDPGSRVVSVQGLAANVACVVLAESGDMTETYGELKTCWRHVGRINEWLFAKCTYIFLHTNSYVSYIATMRSCQHWLSHCVDTVAVASTTIVVSSHWLSWNCVSFHTPYPFQITSLPIPCNQYVPLFVVPECIWWSICGTWPTPLQYHLHFLFFCW